jgi:hypothetical protein
MKMSIRRIVLFLAAGLLILCLAGSAVSALANRSLPTRSKTVDRLASLEKARLGEALHLKAELGERLWPGWGQAGIPVILYNEAYAFLVSLPDPAPGWVKVPQAIRRGGPWEVVPDDRYDGQPYYRSRLPGGGITPEAFTVLIGDRWTASLTTWEWSQIRMHETLRQELPALLRPVFPYRIASRLLFAGSDGYITKILHEAFHAYQGTVVPERLAEAEFAGQNARLYPGDDSRFREAWRLEMDLLVRAVEAESQEEGKEFARAFLDQRRERRQATGLSPALVEYERQREWLEGLALYTELSMWELASQTPGYRPLLQDDPEFNRYEGFGQHLKGQLVTARNMARAPGDSTFYYSGMLQARLLDRLNPGWKDRIWAAGIWLEDLLEDAVRGGGMLYNEAEGEPIIHR